MAKGRSKKVRSRRRCGPRPLLTDSLKEAVAFAPCEKRRASDGSIWVDCRSPYYWHLARWQDEGATSVALYGAPACEVFDADTVDRFERSEAYAVYAEERKQAEAQHLETLGRRLAKQLKINGKYFYFWKVWMVYNQTSPCLSTAQKKNPPMSSNSNLDLPSPIEHLFDFARERPADTKESALLDSVQKFNRQATERAQPFRARYDQAKDEIQIYDPQQPQPQQQQRPTAYEGLVACARPLRLRFRQRWPQILCYLEKQAQRASAKKQQLTAAEIEQGIRDSVKDFNQASQRFRLTLRARYQDEGALVHVYARTNPTCFDSYPTKASEGKEPPFYFEDCAFDLLQDLEALSMFVFRSRAEKK